MKSNLRKSLLIVVLAMCAACAEQKNGAVIDLSGTWTVALDSTDTGLSNGWENRAFAQPIQLPGTTDDAGIGTPCALDAKLEKPQLLHLTRKHSYIGPAWYTREVEIPEAWNGRRIELGLERVVWTTDVWVDGVKAGPGERSLTTPHRYDLTQWLTPGRHRLTVRVDNRKKYDLSVRNLAHAYTDDTQIIWNGIVGEMSLTAFGTVRFVAIDVTPDVGGGQVEVAATLKSVSPVPVGGELRFEVTDRTTGKQVAARSVPCRLEPGSETGMNETLRLDGDVKLWNEFTPNLYEVTVAFDGGGNRAERSEVFGMRSIAADGNRLLVNGTPAFMRGTLECCIFPLTGYPPTDPEGWEKVFRTAKEWGLNHLRFHSWCPPKAAFEVADRLGMYLQVELPVWTLNIGADSLATAFMYEEGERMLAAYGNHPSFCFMSLGNELQPDFGVLNAMRSHFQRIDPRRLYTASSFTFEKGHGVWPEPGDDFYVTQWTKKGWVRGQGVFDSESPRFDRDFSQAVGGMQVPLITHEIGQYAVYPDLAEIPKYTGVLEPLNFRAVENDLKAKGLLQKAPAYTEASGRLAAILYKEEIERALKTAGISGFQLLDLHDFPGQGTALVGLLDAFWDSKGVITAERFRNFCSPVTPLLRFAKAVYTNDEHFLAEIEVSNYGEKALPGQVVGWSVADGGTVLAEGTLPARDLAVGYNAALGGIDVPLAGVETAKALTVRVKLDGTPYENSWSIWVYPAGIGPQFGEVVYTRDFGEARRRVAEGRKVLFNPDWRKLKGVEGKFVPVFWSPVHFPAQAGSMGVLCDPDHPVFAAFPTAMHSDWQWWDLCKRSVAMVTDSIRGGTPLVEMVDNFTNNRRLATLYEGRVGKGELVIASFDLQSDLDDRPVARQMLCSILAYMNSDRFDPEPIANPEVIGELMKQ